MSKEPALLAFEQVIRLMAVPTRTKEMCSDCSVDEKRRSAPTKEHERFIIKAEHSSYWGEVGLESLMEREQRWEANDHEARD